LFKPVRVLFFDASEIREPPLGEAAVTASDYLVAAPAGRIQAAREYGCSTLNIDIEPAGDELKS